MLDLDVKRKQIPTDPGILADLDLELDLEWKVSGSWIGSLPQNHNFGSIPMSALKHKYRTLA